MSFFILSSNNFIVIDGILLLFIMMGDPFSVNFYDMMYTLHLFIFSLPPDLNWRCCHGWAVWCNLFNALVRLLLFQSFEYCLLSSTKPSIYLIDWIFLSGEFIWHPSHFFSITFIIGTLLNTQLVLAWPDPWPCLWIGVVLVNLYVFCETPWLVWILYSILFNELTCSWYTFSGILKERLNNVLRLQIIIS